MAGVFQLSVVLCRYGTSVQFSYSVQLLHLSTFLHGYINLLLGMVALLETKSLSMQCMGKS